MTFRDTGFAPDLAILDGRIAQARILREHHVWEAAKALTLDQPKPGTEPASQRFAALMEADALVDAVLLMVELAKPRRSIGSISHGGKCWACTLRCERDGADHSFEAKHADLAAALLGSLLRSYQPGCACPAQHSQDLPSQ